jgi:hypothetical protein
MWIERQNDVRSFLFCIARDRCCLKSSNTRRLGVCTGRVLVVSELLVGSRVEKRYERGVFRSCTHML